MPPTLSAPTSSSPPRGAPVSPAFPPLSPPRAAAPRLLYIDGLRGLAMLMVLAYHCWLHPVGAAIWKPLLGRAVDITAPLHFGYLGVHLFLVLSGFCLTYPLTRGELQVDPASFARRRAQRILPPYYASLLLFVLLRAAVGRPTSAGDFLAHLLLVHNFWPAWMGSINGAFWFLALSWQLYLAFPLLLWSFRRWGVARTLLAALAITLVYRTWVSTTQDLSTLGKGYFWCYSLPGRLFEFVLGMAAAVVEGERRETRDESSAKALSPRRPLASRLSSLVSRLSPFAFCLAALAATCYWSQFAPVTDILWGVSFGSLLISAGRPGSLAGRCLGWRPLVQMGTISYSVYLVQSPLVRQLAVLLRDRHLSPTATLLLFEGVIAPLMLGVGWLFFRLVEDRGLRPRG